MNKRSSSRDNNDRKNDTMKKTTDTMEKKQLVTITPYNEQEKRVLNVQTSTTTTTTTTMTTTTTTMTMTTTSSSAAPPAPPPLPSKNRGNDDAVEMQSIESFKLKETPSTVPKPPSTYFPVTSPLASASPRHGAVAKAAAGGKDAATSPVAELAKASPSPASPTNVAKSNIKVAIRIGAYEGEAKQPSRLEFLPQQMTSRDKSGVADEVTNGPVVSRLQNELAATLQRSNLRRKTEGENSSPAKSIPENTTSNNDTTNTELSKVPQSNVEKLASALNKVTIKVNPENSNR